MVTFTYECKILEWDDKPQTKRNKKLFSLKTTLLYFMFVVKWKCRFYSCDWLIVFYALSVVFQPHNDDCDHRIEIIWRGKKNQSIGRSMTTFRRPCGQRLVKHAQKRATTLLDLWTRPKAKPSSFSKVPSLAVRICLSWHKVDLYIGNKPIIGSNINIF